MSTSPNNGSTPVIALKSMPKTNEEEVQDSVSNDGKIIGKLTGSDFEFLINKDKVVIGRNSSHGKVDVNIGFSSYVSRKHLKITHYKKRFFLWCMGKNGVFVDGQFQRLGAEPLPLDKACVIRFPSTSIRLSFTPFPQDITQQNGSNIPKTTEILKLPESSVSPIPISVPVPLKHTKSVSPTPNNDDALKEKLAKVASPQPLKYLLPRDPRGFLSAPPSPTGTISALNSCPSSPGRNNSAYKPQNVTDNLTAAASAIAASQQINEEHSEKGEGGDSKPPYSYAQLIIQAISSASLSQLTLSGIYAHITKHYPYYRTADKGWQNSIRHNLSLNRYFVKVPRSQEESGKGSFWRVDPHSERKLVEQAWRKRRQRAIPCFSAPLTTSVSTITRSAPVSPDHLSPMVKGSVQHNNEDHPLKSYDSDAKHQLIHFHSRYAQSAPGSPSNGQQISSSTSISYPDNIVNPSMSAPRPATFLTSSTGVPISNNSMSKMIWPLQPINNQGSHPSMVKQENSSAIIETPATTFSHSGIDASKVSIVMQQPPASGVNTSTLTTLTPQQRQLIQQQHLQQQVVMVAGQQHMQQGIPINIGTLVAAQNQMNNPGLPFIVPGTQQFLVKRVNENNDNDQIPLKKPKVESITQ